MNRRIENTTGLQVIKFTSLELRGKEGGHGLRRFTRFKRTIKKIDFDMIAYDFMLLDDLDVRDDDLARLFMFLNNFIAMFVLLVYNDFFMMLRLPL